jgi:hypothetical protein
MEITTPPKAQTSPPIQRRSTGVKAREYTGPLGILAAGAIGLSLLCSVSAMAMGDLNRYIPLTIVPMNIFDLAVSNLETAAAFTEQAVTGFVPTSTGQPTLTLTVTLIPSATNTPRRFVTITPSATRRTRVPPTVVIIPSRTPTPRPPIATATKTPTKTKTKTKTSIPPTTPVYPDPPTMTNTPIPPYP